MNKILNTITNGIQIGQRTHHQDQVIIPPNFSPIKRIVNSVGKLHPILTFISKVLLYPILKADKLYHNSHQLQKC